MHVLRHGAGVAWHHEIKTVPEEISGGKGSDETMEEARRETERVRRARRRDRQRANRRRPGRPAKAGVGVLGVDGVLEIIRKWDARRREVCFGLGFGPFGLGELSHLA